MDEKARKDLISRIERNEFVTYEMPKYPLGKDILLFVILGIIYPLILLIELLMQKINLDEEVMATIISVRNGYLLMALIFFVAVITIRLISYAKKKNAIYNLGNVTAEEKRLITQGEIVNARFSSVTDSEKGSVLKCEATYNNQTLHFESPAIRAQFLPMNGREIHVFVDKNNPQKYLINIYELIPRKGPKVLSDGTQLKSEAPDEEEHWAKIVMGILGAVLFLLFWPLALVFIIMILTPFASALAALRNGDVITFAGSTVISGLEILAAILVYRKFKKVGVIRRGAKLMRPTNLYLEVIVNKYWTTEYKVKGEKGRITHKVHHISARYLEPGTDYVYDFCATGPEIISRLENKEARVYVDPKNMNRYYIDFASALRNMGMNYTDNGFTFDSNGIWYEK